MQQCGWGQTDPYKRTTKPWNVIIWLCDINNSQQFQENQSNIPTSYFLQVRYTRMHIGGKIIHVPIERRPIWSFQQTIVCLVCLIEKKVLGSLFYMHAKYFEQIKSILQRFPALNFPIRLFCLMIWPNSLQFLSNIEWKYLSYETLYSINYSQDQKLK